MWYLTGETQELPRTQFDTQDEALVMLGAQGFEQVDGAEDWTTYEWENPFDGQITSVTLKHD